MKNIGVFFGSRSAEHDISIITGQLIISGLKGLGYTVTPVYVTKQGKWMIGEELGELKNFTDQAKKIEDENKFAEYYLDLEESVGKMVFKKKGLAGKSVTVDVAFPAFHGTYGEDGDAQGLFEMLGVPYVGAGVAASAIAMDKALTKTVMQQAGIPTTKFICFEKREWEKIENRKQIIEKIKEMAWPVFVKPVHLGSSIGIGKAKNQDLKELENKIEVALHYDNKVLVEEGVEGVTDLTCCVIGNEELIASEIQESVFNKDLFDFEDKYINDGGAQTGNATSNLIIPARIDKDLTEKIKEAAKQVYRALGCSGISRVDFLFDKQSGKFYANEVNPLPGTLYHHLWKASGIELPQLIEKLLAYADEAAEQKRQVNLSFESSFLKNLGGSKMGGSKLKHRFAD